jgi:hypothetical protein
MLSLVTAFLTTTLPAKPMQAPPPPPRATRAAGSAAAIAAIAYGRFHLRLLQKPARGFYSTDSRLFRFDHDSAMVYSMAWPRQCRRRHQRASAITASASFRYASGARCALGRVPTRVKRGRWRHDSKQKAVLSHQSIHVSSTPAATSH